MKQCHWTINLVVRLLSIFSSGISLKIYMILKTISTKKKNEKKLFSFQDFPLALIEFLL